MSYTEKDLFGDGYTTYNDDGTTSHTYKDLFGDGYTTYHSNGDSSHTYKDIFGDGYTTYHSGGGSSHTDKDLFGDGYTTYHSNGSTSHTYKNLFGDGYTTYNSGGNSYAGYGGNSDYYVGIGDGYTGSYGGGYSGGFSGSIGSSFTHSIPLKNPLNKGLFKLNSLVKWGYFAFLVFVAYRLYSFFVGNLPASGIHLMAKYFIWVVAAWSFTDMLSGGDLLGPKVAGSISFIIFSVISEAVLCMRMGVDESQALKALHYVGRAVLMFIAIILVSGLIGKAIRLLLSSISYKEGRKRKLLRILNCFVLALFVLQIITILYSLLTSTSVWDVQGQQLLSYALLSVAWAFTDSVSNENRGITNFFMLLGLVWYIGILLRSRAISLDTIEIGNWINVLWPCAAYLVVYKISKILGRKLR